MRAGLLSLALLLVLAAPAAAAPHLTPLGSFDAPVYVTSPPGDQRIFVVEKGGRIELVGGGTFLDISTLVNGLDDERGLLSMAFAPDYPSSGRFYVYYTARDPNGEVRVVEYKRSADPNVADPATARPIYATAHSAAIHNGGQLQFGPDGMLYASIGDNGHGGNAQDLSVPFGKILRINPATGAYSIWSYGLRNPWRFSFDRATGDIAIGDVGENQFEEVDWGTAPGSGQNVNFGWPTSEGFGSSGQNPIVAHSHGGDGFCAIVGGYVVHDASLPTLDGRYLYGDNCNGSLWTATPRTGAGDAATDLKVTALSSLGQDACGHIYAASLTGPVYRIDDGPQAACVAATDHTAPRVTARLSGVRTALKKRRLRVTVRCSERCGVAIGTRLRKVRRLATRRRNLTAHHRKVVTLRLGKPTVKHVRKRLRHHRFVKLSVTVRATDAAGNTRTVHRGGKLKR
jgi:hypothetical protein